MQYDMAAHRTFYNGTWFRSRLEAKWAAFFDICNWRWEYEPIDLKGWVPDFTLEQTLLVEIKPIVFSQDSSRRLDGDLAKCKACPVGQEILILGTGPFSLKECGAYESDDGSTSGLGLLCCHESQNNFCFDEAILKQNEKNEFDVGGNFGKWWCRVSFFRYGRIYQRYLCRQSGNRNRRRSFFRLRCIR